MKTKFGNFLSKYAKSKKPIPEKKIFASFYAILILPITVFLIPKNILENSYFLTKFCEFMSQIFAVVKICTEQGIPGNLLFFLSYMMPIAIIYWIFFSYSFFISFFNKDIPFGERNDDFSKSPFFYTTGLIIMIGAFGWAAYNVFSGEILTFKNSRRSHGIEFITTLSHGSRFDAGFLMSLISGILCMFSVFFIEFIKYIFDFEIKPKRVLLKFFIIFMILALIYWAFLS